MCRTIQNALTLHVCPWFKPEFRKISSELSPATLRHLSTKHCQNDSAVKKEALGFVINRIKALCLFQLLNIKPIKAFFCNLFTRQYKPYFVMHNS